MARARPGGPEVEHRCQDCGNPASQRMSKDGRLVVGLVQMDPALGDRASNLERHRHWVRQAGEAGVRLLGFPPLTPTALLLTLPEAENAHPPRRLSLGIVPPHDADS